MKAQNREEKMAKAQEREQLQREIAARERAERIQVKIQLYDKDLKTSNATHCTKI